MLGYNKRVRKQINQIIQERFGNAPEEYSTAKCFEQIIAKGLIIHDKEDDIIPYNDAIQIQAKYKNSVLITTEGFGHSLINDEVSNYIYEFLDN